MPATLVVPPELHEQVSSFVAAQGLPLAVATEPPTDPTDPVIDLVQGDRGQQCGPDRLVAGGRMPCGTALAMARRVRVPAIGLGALLEELSIKIGSCSLGCF